MVLPLCSLGCASALLPFCTAVRSPASNRGLLAGDHPRRSAGQRPNSGKRVGAARAAAGTDELILDQVESLWMLTLSHLVHVTLLLAHIHSHICFTPHSRSCFFPSSHSWLTFTCASGSRSLSQLVHTVLTAGAILSDSYFIPHSAHLVHIYYTAISHAPAQLVHITAISRLTLTSGWHLSHMLCTLICTSRSHFCVRSSPLILTSDSPALP